MCPSQSWPKWLFKGAWGGNWKIRRRYRSYLDAHLEYNKLWRAYADQFPDGRYRGRGKPNPPPDLPRLPTRIR